MNSSQPTPAGSHQVRLALRAATMARLLELQARSVAAGHRKPSYSELLDCILARLDAPDIDALLQASSEAAA